MYTCLLMEQSNQCISVCLWSSLIKVYLFSYGAVKSRYTCLLMEQSNQGIPVCLWSSLIKVHVYLFAYGAV